MLDVYSEVQYTSLFSNEFAIDLKKWPIFGAVEVL